MSTDKCPTGCGRAQSRGKFLCSKCWAEVPADLQRDVYRTWRAYSKAASTHADNFRETRDAYYAAREAALAAIR